MDLRCFLESLILYGVKGIKEYSGRCLQEYYTMTVEQPHKTCVSCSTILDWSLPIWAKQCAKCHKDVSTKRLCRICKIPKLLKTDPVWKDVCGSCYINSGTRACVGCDGTIPAVEPAWKTCCKTCYNDKSKWRGCELCKAVAIQPFAGGHVKLCRVCYKATKKERVPPAVSA